MSPSQSADLTIWYQNCYSLLHLEECKFIRKYLLSAEFQCGNRCRPRNDNHKRNCLGFANNHSANSGLLSLHRSQTGYHRLWYLQIWRRSHTSRNCGVLSSRTSLRTHLDYTPVTRKVRCWHRIWFLAWESRWRHNWRSRNSQPGKKGSCR
jgi:hypothetical protein